MVYTRDLKSLGRKPMRVRIPPAVPNLATCGNTARGRGYVVIKRAIGGRNVYRDRGHHPSLSEVARLLKGALGSRKMIRDLERFISELEKKAIGFNQVAPSILHEATINYPPFNVVKVADGNYVVEMALAGFAKEEIKVTQNSNFVFVTGEKEDESDREYIHHGIASRKFKREIPVANGFEVVSAEMRDGILSINLKNKNFVVKEITVL